MSSIPYFKTAFIADRETKNAIKYEEVTAPDRPVFVGTLYVKKTSLPTPAPTRIVVTVEADTD